MSVKQQNPSSVKVRLNLVLAIFALAGVFGVLGIVEMNKGATLHHLNFLHLKFNHTFNEELQKFSQGAENFDALYREAENIRQQPVECLRISGPLERTLMAAFGTSEALGVCERDLALANNTLATLSSYKLGLISRRELISEMRASILQFFENSKSFGPPVVQTVSIVAWVMITFSVFKAILGIWFTFILARGILRDYQTLEESEERLALAVDGSSDGLYDWNLLTKQYWYSPILKEMFNWQNIEEEKGPAYEFQARLHPEDSEQILAELSSIRERQGDSFELEYRLRRDDGQYNWVRDRGSISYCEAGKVTRVCGALQDITVRKKIEAELDDERAEMQLILDNLPAYIFYKDRHNNILLANKAAAASHNLEPEDMRNQPSAKFYPEMAEKYHRDDLEVFESGNSKLDIVEPYDTPDGQEAWVQTDKILIPGDEGEEDKLLVVASDISALKRYERELEDSNQTLRDAEKRAQLAVEAKSAFLANMSHEIRTPLTSIIGYAEGLQFSEYEGEEYEEAVASIAGSGKHLLQLINDILDLSRIEAGGLQIEERATSISEVISSIDTTFSNSAREKGLEFRTLGEFPLPKTVYTDAFRLRQVLFNLVGNAIKFTSDGSITILTRYKADAEELTFEVRDTGCGIPEDAQETLFRSFQQAEMGISRKYGGSGLGLAISQELAERLGGGIAVQSKPGLGSTFTLRVKVRDVSGEIDTFSRERASLAPKPSINVLDEEELGGRIILADDNPVNLKLVANLLKKSGFEVACATNGQQVLDLVQSDQCDLLLLDLEMPVLSGYQAAELLNKDPNFTAPIVALTAHAVDEARDRCAGLGMQGFLLKPIARNELLDTVRGMLQRQ